MEILFKIQQEIKAPKNQYNKFGGYNYRSLEDITEAFKTVAAKHNVALLLSDDIVQIGDRYYIKASAKLIDKSGKVIAENTAFARESENKKGMDDAQVTGAASSYARKYALNGLFALDDTKDPDTEEHHRTTSYNSTPQKQAAGFDTKTAAPANGKRKKTESFIDQLAESKRLVDELDKEKQTLVKDLKEFFPNVGLNGFIKLLSKPEKDPDALADLIKWYLYFAADCDKDKAEQLLKEISEYKGKSLNTPDDLYHLSPARVAVIYGKAKDILYKHIQKLKGFEVE